MQPIPLQISLNNGNYYISSLARKLPIPAVNNIIGSTAL